MNKDIVRETPETAKVDTDMSFMNYIYNYISGSETIKEADISVNIDGKIIEIHKALQPDNGSYYANQPVTIMLNPPYKKVI